MYMHVYNITKLARQLHAQVSREVLGGCTEEGSKPHAPLLDRPPQKA